ncbi:SDR family NAD(P)-dependent oxidoreductase [Actinacidiphila acididurans]|uniref:SDR family NAD(P)-dependent oxidoreductase n=1 Tax=Actinacidiphila acididurans TaxID=2784346 RepID=A0ABS2U5I8_9ACTN|nr:SDR family NAD(P)-dependent oxidoreductase [Actinacidiphila acididurans]MBM9510627.1 SDR family NAD(P)-dependent oxidoreductase [Actinacidiphila acididurans]
MVSIADRTLLVTGSHRGIGLQLVEEALRRGAKRVYAADVEPFTHPDERVVPIHMDVTDREQIAKAVEQVESLDILINNAGIAIYDDLTDRAIIEKHLAVNLFGIFDVTQAFLPLLVSSKGVLVNNLSVNALAPLPLIPAYSVSKAAAFSLTQSLRSLLAPQGVRVHAILTGPVDTVMTKDLHIPKTSPQDVARGMLDGLENDEEEIFPDGMAQSLAEGWRAGPAKGLEGELAGLATAMRDTVPL